MRILYLDCDTLRPDHLGCYGYHRNTSPNIDRIAAGGVRCENVYVSDAPCLPSRAALYMGRFGIHTGVVGHGGSAADPRPEGPTRGFRQSTGSASWMDTLRQAGLHTVSISSFAERHSAWWFARGFSEMYNPGLRGMETAEQVTSIALDWVSRNGRRDDWFLQVNMWDPHTPYRTPLGYGNPFAADPPPPWMTPEKIAADYAGYGPHSAQDVAEMGPNDVTRWPRLPQDIADVASYKQWIDGYDTGIRYMDDHVGMMLDALDRQGVLDDTVIIVSSDHGENQGELNVYGDHQTADHITSRVPLIIRWPGLAAGVVDSALHYSLDLPPTMAELLDVQAPALWDGHSFAGTLAGGKAAGRETLVVSQCAWACQRAVRWENWILIRTYDDGLKDYPPVMLYDLGADPHELVDLAPCRPDVVSEGLARLEQWLAEMLTTSSDSADPLWTVMREGGPYHTRGRLAEYVARLRQTGRETAAEALLMRHAHRSWRSPGQP